MLESKAASQLFHDQEGTRAERSSMADDSQADRSPKKRGNLAATLDPLLEPRVSAGRPGRPKGSGNYEWTPEADGLIMELCAKWARRRRNASWGAKSRNAGRLRPRPDRTACAKRLSTEWLN